MEVLMMSGAYAGEIRDVKPFYARQMLQDGRAVDPNELIHARKAAEVAVPEAPPATAKKAAVKRAASR